jgi:DNA-binding beta-propeller fold protein YncE
LNLSKAMFLSTALLAFAIGTAAQDKASLKLLHSTPIPELKDGDFDHLTADVAGNRLFVTAEENSKVLVFDLKTDKLIYTIADLKAPHSMLYREDLKKLFVADSDLGEVKIYDTDSYKPAGSIKVRDGADASAYDPAAKLYYVVNGGKDAKMPNAYITIIDVDAGKSVGDIKIDSDDVEGVAFEKSGPRMFVNVRGKSAVEVYDRKTRTLLNTWSTAEAGKNPTSMSFDEDAHRLFLGTRAPAKLVVLDSDSGKVVTSYPAAAMVDDMAYDSQSKRIYFAGTEFLDVFHETDADHYDRIGHVATAFRAKTGVLVPELKRYYLAVPHHEKQIAELRVYEVLP